MIACRGSCCAGWRSPPSQAAMMARTEMGTRLLSLMRQDVKAAAVVGFAPHPHFSKDILSLVSGAWCSQMLGVCI